MRRDRAARRGDRAGVVSAPGAHLSPMDTRAQLSCHWSLGKKSMLGLRNTCRMGGGEKMYLADQRNLLVLPSVGSQQQVTE